MVIFKILVVLSCDLDQFFKMNCLLLIFMIHKWIELTVGKVNLCFTEFLQVVKLHLVYFS